MIRKTYSLLLVVLLLLTNCTGNNSDKIESKLPVYSDVPYLQDYSIKHYSDEPGAALMKVVSDRNDVIQILSSKGLRKPFDGEFLYPGTIENDVSYRPMADKKITSIGVYENQLVYLDDIAVLGNAWAGKLYSRHGMPGAKLFCGGKDFTFLVSDGETIKCIQDSLVLWEGKLPGANIIDIRYQKDNDLFWILNNNSLSKFSVSTKKIEQFVSGNDFTSFDLTADNSKAIIGTTNGYLEYDVKSKKQSGEIKCKLPCTEITAINEIDGNMWFGSTFGAFMLREDGKFNYYNGERWLPGDSVKHISKGPENSVLVLTNKGLGQICFKKMTLEDKAIFYEKQVRQRHIRNGFNASLEGMKDGNLSSGYLRDSDNDGLWTSMYLGGEIFRYAVTKSDEALQNCLESLDAMERLYSINSIPGFPSRSFERSGYINVLSDPDRWQHAKDPEWDWKATTSSDEAIGHIFALGAMAELIDVESMQKRAIFLIDILMQHIVDHNMTLVDYDGKPTQWGKWNPEYVNALPKRVGDRKLNSSNIIGMLQTAYHFTHKEIYKEKAFELMDKHGYLENLMLPMNERVKAPADAGKLRRVFSGSWNHSDDEMYFVGYWGLYRYAFNEELKAKYKDAIIDHWEIERPEKDGAWNIFTAMVSSEFDLNEAVWYLQEHPLDMINWDIMNSHRKDIEIIEPNFRNQTIREVLPPDERPVQRHNGNMFNIDKKRGNGNGEESAGDIWLLPYWMGHYLGVITEPIKNN
ncbi:MAG: hypothetical protein WC854_12115 [Bacteroidales bacterium]